MVSSSSVQDSTESAQIVSLDVEREKSLWEKDDVVEILSCVPRNTPLLVNL